MGDWIKRGNGSWLGMPRVKVNKPSPETETKKEVKPLQYGILFYPLKCPRCNSKNIKTHTSKPPIRYHKCKDCNYNFRSIEAKGDAPKVEIPVPMV